MPAENKQKQEPFKTNQIENKKPNAPRTISLLEGNIANSMNGGHNRTIAFKKVMAGEKHHEYRISMHIQMLTPLTPSYQNLKATIRTYFVPNSRIWTNAEKYTAQKGGTTEIKIKELPNTKNLLLPVLSSNLWQIPIQHTTAWRDAFISSYIPRIGINKLTAASENLSAVPFRAMPTVSILPLRGRIAIYNDFERNKEYDTVIPEYKTDAVSQVEWNSYMPIDYRKMDLYNMRAKRPNNYYTDYRTSYQGFAENAPNVVTDNGYRSFTTWADWENKIAEARSQAENSQKNDWDIIAELRGSKKLTEGKVQLIGEKSFNLNYSAVTQNAYNTNTEIQPEFQVMGKQGAYSYTNINMPIYAGFEAVEEGYIHVIMTVSAETVFETGIDRNEINVTPLSEYRPDLIDEKFDVMYEIENGTTNGANQNIIGYKRKFSEYFKLSNTVAGDCTSLYYREIKEGTATSDITTPSIELEPQPNNNFDTVNVITQKTYQFFETDRNQEAKSSGEYEENKKKIWKDYTDLMINKNQAIENEIEVFTAVDNTNEFRIKGQNQIFFVGKTQLIAELPINEEIKQNFTTWGEH